MTYLRLYSVAIHISILSFIGVGNAYAAVFTHVSSVSEIQAKLARLPEHGKSRAKAVLHSELGMLLYKKGEMREAAVQLEKALEFDTNRRLRRQIYLYLGKSYESHNRLDKAISAYSNALRSDPKNWRRYHDLAVVYDKAKLYDSALSNFDKAIQLNPKEPTLYLLKARSCRKYELYEKAEKNAIKSVELGLRDPLAKYELSFIYEGQGRFVEAAALLGSLLNDKSPDEDWCRLIVLASLAKNWMLAHSGLNQLKARKVDRQTAQFYQQLITYMSKNPNEILAYRKSPSEIRFMVETHVRDGSF